MTNVRLLFAPEVSDLLMVLDRAIAEGWTPTGSLIERPGALNPYQYVVYKMPEDCLFITEEEEQHTLGELIRHTSVPFAPSKLLLGGRYWANYCNDEFHYDALLTERYQPVDVINVDSPTDVFQLCQ